MKNIILITCSSLFFLTSCEPEEKKFDASGSFSAIETVISSQANGMLNHFTIEEGQVLRAGAIIGHVDTIQLHLKKKQIFAQIKAIQSRSPDIAAQTSFYDDQLELLNTQLANLNRDLKRLENLVAGNAAPQKQLDDINSKISEVLSQKEVVKKQKSAQVSALNTQSKGLSHEPLALQAQIDQINDQINKCQIVNPLDGTVLTTFAEEKEMTAVGKPLYKIADLTAITLRAYITGDQLAKVRLNDEVIVMTDDGDGGYYEERGQITWINNKSEFTPKTIQTKEERANLVYAIKIKVPNDGRYKIGMYGEIKFL